MPKFTSFKTDKATSKIYESFQEFHVSVVLVNSPLTPTLTRNICRLLKRNLVLEFPLANPGTFVGLELLHGVSVPVSV